MVQGLLCELYSDLSGLEANCLQRGPAEVGLGSVVSEANDEPVQQGVGETERREEGTV